jgi:hypothetical protein
MRKHIINLQWPSKEPQIPKPVEDKPKHRYPGGSLVHFRDPIVINWAVW